MCVYIAVKDTSAVSVFHSFSTSDGNRALCLSLILPSLPFIDAVLHACTVHTVPAGIQPSGRARPVYEKACC